MTVHPLAKGLVYLTVVCMFAYGYNYELLGLFVPSPTLIITLVFAASVTESLLGDDTEQEADRPTTANGPPARRHENDNKPDPAPTQKRADSSAELDLDTTPLTVQQQTTSSQPAASKPSPTQDEPPQEPPAERPPMAIGTWRQGAPREFDATDRMLGTPVTGYVTTIDGRGDQLILNDISMYGGPPELEAADYELQYRFDRAGTADGRAEEPNWKLYRFADRRRATWFATAWMDRFRDGGPGADIHSYEFAMDYPHGIEMRRTDSLN